MHNEIRKQIRKRRRIHRIAKRINTSEQWQVYRTQRNKVTNLIKEAKKEYYRKLTDRLTNEKKSSKSWWKLCKFLYCGKTDQYTIPPLISDDIIISSDIEKANAFNKYFVSVSRIENYDDDLPDG